MIFLRPTVLRNAAQAGTLSNERYRVLGLDQQAINPEARFMMPEMTNPGMPMGAPVPVPTNPTAEPRK